MFWLLLFAVAAVVLAYAGARLATTTAVFAVAILFYGLFGHSLPLFLLLTVAWIALLMPLNVEALRQEWYTHPLLKRFARRLPAPGARERLALAVDGSGWEAQLLEPRLDWDRLRALPGAELTEEERAFLDGPVETFCRLCDEWQITRQDADLSGEAWTFLRRYGLLAMRLPPAFGGAGFSATAVAAVSAKIASSPGGIGAATVVACANAPGAADWLIEHGSDAQKVHWLPRLASGEDLACVAPGDFGVALDPGGAEGGRGEIVEDLWQGERVVGIRLQLNCSAVPLAPVASLVVALVQLRDPRQLLGRGIDLGPACVLIPSGTPGVAIGRRHWALDNPVPIGPLQVPDLFVPLDWLLGGVAQLDAAAALMPAALAAGRKLPLAAACAGQALFAALASAAWVRMQRQDGRARSDALDARAAMARNAAHAYAADALWRMAAAAQDRGERSLTAAALLGEQATMLARAVTQDAMDLLGIPSALLGPSNWLGRRWQGLPVMVAAARLPAEPALQTAFAPGVLRSHPYLRAEIAAAHDDNAAHALEDFDALIWPHAGRLLGAAARSLVLGLSGSLGATVPGGTARRHRQRASRYAAALSLATEATAWQLGPDAAALEGVNARLSEVQGLLMRACAVLRKWDDQDRPADDWPIVDRACLELYREIEIALTSALRRMPWLPVRWLLRGLIFPLGRWARPPKASLDGIVAARLCSPGSSRQRLIAACFAPRTAGGPLSRLEAALSGFLAAEVLLCRCQGAQAEGRLPPGPLPEGLPQAVAAGVLTAEEAQRLDAALAAVAQAGALDDFALTDLAVRAPDK